MSDPSFAFVLKLRSFMAHLPRLGALVQPAPIRAPPAHFGIPNRGSEHRGNRKEGSRSLGGSIDMQIGPIERWLPTAERDRHCRSSTALPMLLRAHAAVAPPKARAAIRRRGLAVLAPGSAPLRPIRLSGARDWAAGYRRLPCSSPGTGS